MANKNNWKYNFEDKKFFQICFLYNLGVKLSEIPNDTKLIYQVKGKEFLGKKTQPDGISRWKTYWNINQNKQEKIFPSVGLFFEFK